MLFCNKWLEKALVGVNIGDGNLNHTYLDNGM